MADGSVTNILDNDNVKLKTGIPETPHNMTFLKGKQFNFSSSDTALSDISALEKPSNGKWHNGSKNCFSKRRFDSEGSFSASANGTFVG
ncbi:hypothetical protein QS257_21350 [Terrilactibacillus sp. S3-3]|nr:hypothetical protein QS257_21350 [Terrilactibacillus sp. S3-3]